MGQERNGDTRERLLDAVLRVAAARGLDKVTWRSVAAEAGYSHSLVQFYFGTGDEMITQALYRSAEIDVEQSALASDTLDGFLSDLSGSAVSEAALGLLQYEYLLRAVRGTIPMERIAKMYDVYRDQVAGTLARLHIDDDEEGSLASVVLAAADGLILQHVIYGSTERTDLAVAKLRSLLADLVPADAAVPQNGPDPS
ncbi:TetR/AcrR family transcriptional regulator [Microbacterium gorillae]|uniref:TetR/AcrR family transcriptional regulator n=1 Tax=Microbacterium gorillae TaxID=1231063 RepID=UPI0006938657|nr:TetR/AcrR family transcriptional regulator [Microbacterium gorillae]